MMNNNQTGDIALLRAAYSSSNRRMFVCYDRARRILWSYSRGADSTRALASSLGVHVETVRLWALAGACRIALRGMTFTDETEKVWTVWDLRQALSNHHWMIAGKFLKAEACSPENLFEWLTIAAVENKSAEWLASQLAPTPSNQFTARFERLFSTVLPQDWPDSKRQACRQWLKQGRELLLEKP